MIHHTRLNIQTRGEDPDDQSITIYVSGPIDPGFDRMVLDNYQSTQIKSVLEWSREVNRDR